MGVDCRADPSNWFHFHDLRRQVLDRTAGGGDEKSVGDLLRSRGLVSIVAILDVHSGGVEIHHSLGVETGVSDSRSMQSLVSRMLLNLPSSSYSSEGIRRSAGI